MCSGVCSGIVGMWICVVRVSCRGIIEFYCGTIQVSVGGVEVRVNSTIFGVGVCVLG